MPDFAFKLVYADGTEFRYTSPYELTQIDPGQLSYRVPYGDTPGIEGGFQDAVTYADMRNFSYSGTIVAQSLTQLRTYWDAFQAGHNTTGTAPVQFWHTITNDDGSTYQSRYLTGRIRAFGEGVTQGFNYKEWNVALHCQPYWYDGTVYGFSLTVGGTANLSVLGNVRARPTILLNFTAGGTATVRSLATGHAFNLTATQAGVFSVDCDKALSGQYGGAVLRGNTVPVINDLYGQFLEFNAGTNPVALILSGGASVSWGSAIVRPRYQSA